jgi:hypothetical protein
MEFLASTPYLFANPTRDPARGPDTPAAPCPRALADEALVVDARAELTPAQMVERKLLFLLKSQPIPVSHMTTRRSSRSR